jgi:prophage regulatory protein
MLELDQSQRRLVLIPAVLSRVPFSKATLWREIKAGRFPKPVDIAPRRRAFFEDEIDAWLANRVAERDAKSEAAA